LRYSEVPLKGKNKTLVKIWGGGRQHRTTPAGRILRGRDPCNPCGVDAYGSHVMYVLYSYIKSIIHYLFQNCTIIRYYCWCTNYCIRAINCLQLLATTLFQIMQFIVIVLEVAVIYICCPRKLLLVKKLIKFKTIANC